MVNLLLACSAAVAGALIGSVSGDLIINKRIAVDTSEGVENAKVVEIPKRENKKAIPEKKNAEKQQKPQPKESDTNTAESPNQHQDQNDEPVIEKVTGEVVENTTSEPVVESESVDQNIVEQQVYESKAAEVESQNQDLSGTPDEPNIVTNTDETQPAQFTPIDKQGESEQQATTENKKAKAKGGK